MRKDVTNFWKAWRETCDIRECMNVERLRKLKSQELALDAELIAADARDIMRITNKYLADWISKPRKVEALKGMSAESRDEEVESGSDEEHETSDARNFSKVDNRGHFASEEGESVFSNISESDDDNSHYVSVISSNQKFASGRRVSEFQDYVQLWRSGDLNVPSAFEFIQVDLYNDAQKGEKVGERTYQYGGEIKTEPIYEPMFKGKKLKDYLFEDIGSRNGGISKNLWGYLLKKGMVRCNGREYPSRLIMVADKSFKGSAVEVKGTDNTENQREMAVVPEEIGRNDIDVEEAASELRKILDKRWVNYNTSERVVLWCAFMKYNLSDKFVEKVTNTSGKRLNDVKIRCVGEVFTSLKNGGFDIDTVRRLFYSRGQEVLGEFVGKDKICMEVEKYFCSLKKTEKALSGDLY